MKKEIIDILINLLKYKTVSGSDNSEEFDGIFSYIKNNLCDGLIVKDYVFNDRKALVISNYDVMDFDLLFCTHIDVVFCNDYSIVENKTDIYGRGTIDMKGSVAVLISIMNNLNTDKKIGLFITSDEEIDGYCCSKLLEIYNCKFCIVPDGGKNFQLVVKEKGIMQLKVMMGGVNAHSSQPYNGVNSIDKLIDVYQKLKDEFPMPTDNSNFITTINLSKIAGGKSINQVPDYSEMYLDIRFVSDFDKNKIIKLLDGVDYEILFESSLFECDLNNKYVQKYIDVCEYALKAKVLEVGCESTSDAIYFYNKGIPTVIMNPVGDFPHCDGEFINKDSLVSLYKIYEKVIKEMNFYEKN